MRTREAILRAAQKLFAEKGYTTTGVREVALEACVNSALIRRYFASKEGLLRAAVEDVLKVEPFIAGGRDGFGARAIATLLQAEAGSSPLAMMVLATADPAARALCQDLLYRHIVVPLARWLGGPGAVERAFRLNLLWIGFMTARRILPTGPFDDAPDRTAAWLAAATQAIVDEAADGAPACRPHGRRRPRPACPVRPRRRRSWPRA